MITVRLLPVIKTEQSPITLPIWQYVADVAFLFINSVNKTSKLNSFLKSQNNMICELGSPTLTVRPLLAINSEWSSLTLLICHYVKFVSINSVNKTSKLNSLLKSLNNMITVRLLPVIKTEWSPITLPIWQYVADVAFLFIGSLNNTSKLNSFLKSQNNMICELGISHQNYNYHHFFQISI